MLTFSLRAAIAALVSATLLCAQAGNEVVFVGSATSGSTDTHYFVESGTGLAQQGNTIHTDNVTDAVWADGGRNLYVAQDLQAQVALAQWDGSAATWSTFFAAPGHCYGLGMDALRKRLWTLTGPNANSRQLVCLDADPLSPGYGSVLATTSLGTGTYRERWGLSRSGNLAAVPHAFGSSIEVIDTDPNSPTFLQPVVSTSIPGMLGVGFAIVSAADVRLDDQYAYVVWSGLGAVTLEAGLGVLHIPTQTWLDFSPAPGHQDLSIAPAQVPNSMALSIDGSFAMISAQAAGGSLVRIDFDYATPANTTVTQLGIGISLPNCDGVSLSPDNTRVAVTATPVFLSAPSYLAILDVQTGVQLQYVTLNNMWNVYTTAWQDASPTATFTPYGIGCAGTAGTPTWTAAPGSRPALGSTFTAIAGNLPFGLAVMQFGLTNIPGGLDLVILGMPGCFLHPSPIASFVLFGPGSSASWQLVVPGTPSLFGAQFHTQAFPFDPAANSFGFTASNAAIGVLGF